MKPNEEQWLNEIAEILWQKGEQKDLNDLQFIELLLHNETLDEEKRKRVIKIEERVRRYGVER